MFLDRLIFLNKEEKGGLYLIIVILLSFLMLVINPNPIPLYNKYHFILWFGIFVFLFYLLAIKPYGRSKYKRLFFLILLFAIELVIQKLCCDGQDLQLVLHIGLLVYTILTALSVKTVILLATLFLGLYYLLTNNAVNTLSSLILLYVGFTLNNL